MPSDDFPSSSEVPDPPSSPDPLSDQAEVSPPAVVHQVPLAADHAETAAMQNERKYHTVR